MAALNERVPGEKQRRGMRAIYIMKPKGRGKTCSRSNLRRRTRFEEGFHRRPRAKELKIDNCPGESRASQWQFGRHPISEKDVASARENLYRTWADGESSPLIYVALLLEFQPAIIGLLRCDILLGLTDSSLLLLLACASYLSSSAPAPVSTSPFYIRMKVARNMPRIPSAFSPTGGSMR